VQLYLQDVVSSLSRPVRELAGFRRVTLVPGETRTVSLELGPGELGFYDRRCASSWSPASSRSLSHQLGRGTLESFRVE